MDSMIPLYHSDLFIKENVGTEGRTAFSSFKPGQVKGTTRYAVGTASSKTQPTTGIVAGIKDSVTGLTNQDQRTLTKFGTTIAMTQDLYDEIIGDRFGSDRQQMLDQIFEVQKGLDAKDGYSKDVDNRMAENLAKQYGIEYKGQSYAQLTAIDVPDAVEKALEEEEAAKKPDAKTKQEEAAIAAGEQRKQEAIAAAANLPAGYKISVSGKSAAQIRKEVGEKLTQKKQDDARRQREEASRRAKSSGSGFDYDSGPDAFGGTGQSSGTDFGGTGYESDTGEAMVAEGGLIKKTKLAQQMKQSGLASKK